MTWRRRAAARSDDGSVLPLVAGMTALALVVTLTVVAASSLYLERKRLMTVADGAALAGAEAFSLDTVEVTGGRVRPVLTSEEVAHAVHSYLATDLSTPVEDMRLVAAGTADGRSATVTLAGRWAPPVLLPVLPEGVPLDVTVTARSVFR